MESANRTSLAVQWLRLHTPTAGGMGSIPRPHRGTKISHAGQCGKKKKKKGKKNKVLTHWSTLSPMTIDIGLDF